ncbi:MAG: type II secretion system F family protein [Planctomycetaceae bacterium]|nr:type II secretion system F family protein [Planctomycetaceae bacterium]
MFGGRASLKSLTATCRSLGSMLDAGVDVKKAFEISRNKLSDSSMRKTLEDIETQIRSGSDISAAMEDHAGFLPRLMIDMVNVGEQTGSLPEVLSSLADHFENRQRLRRDFLSVIAWPCIQFVAAVLIIALLIVVLGVVAETRGGESIDVLGLGLVGPKGAIIWLTSVFGSLLAVYIGYMLINRSIGGKQTFDSFLLQVPVLGASMRAFAVARFSWAFSLTQQSGMSIKPSIETSFKATANGAFIKQTGQVWADLQHGEFLGEALRKTGLFPEEFVETVQVAENTGTVPEQLARLSPQFEEEARRKLSMLATTLGWLVWCCVAVFIIVLIFKVAQIYLGALEQAGRPI